MSKKKRNFSRKKKLSILRRHMVDKEPVSQICEDIQVHPNQFYKWQSELFDSESTFFKERGTTNREIKELKAQNEKLSKKLSKKDNIITEITEDYVRLKKNNSEIFGENG